MLPRCVLVGSLFTQFLVTAAWSYQAAAKKPPARPKPAAGQGSVRQPAPAATPHSTTSRPQLGQPDAAKLSPDDLARKRQILNGDRFRQAKFQFDQWLSIQKVYSRQQIPGLRAAFRKRINAMTPAELEDFLGQMEAKLAILMSPEAQDARDWIGYFASVQAVIPASEVKKFDIANMTPAQMEQALREIESRRASRGQASQSFNVMRQQQVEQQLAENQRRQAEQAAAAARMAAASTSSAGSPYAVRPPRQPQTTSHDMPMWLSPRGVGFFIP
jgi:hypothetical protein